MEHLTFYYSLRHDQKIAVAPLHAPMLFFLPSQQVVMSNSFSFIELVAFFSSAEFYCSGSQTAAPGCHRGFSGGARQIISPFAIQHIHTKMPQ
jgi:hypothetical protein